MLFSLSVSLHLYSVFSPQYYAYQKCTRAKPGDLRPKQCVFGCRKASGTKKFHFDVFRLKVLIYQLQNTSVILPCYLPWWWSYRYPPKRRHIQQDSIFTFNIFRVSNLRRHVINTSLICRWIFACTQVSSIWPLRHLRCHIGDVTACGSTLTTELQTFVNLVVVLL